MLFFGNPIRSRVLAVLNKRIDDAEAEFKVACTVIDENAEMAHEKIEQQKEMDKEERADRLVRDIVNRVV